MSRWRRSLAECSCPPVICPDGEEPLPDGSCPPVECPDGGDPLADGSCPPVECPDGGYPLADGSCPRVECPYGGDPLSDGSCLIECGPGTNLENEKCVPNKNNGGGSSSSFKLVAITIVNLIGPKYQVVDLTATQMEYNKSLIRLRYRACGLYPNGQISIH